jgi:nicotinate phosphoribosyltransferase
MMQVVLHHFPAAEVEYRFKCRTPGVDLTPYIGPIEREITALCGLRFAPRELDYLRSWRFLKGDFVDLLDLFQLDERFIKVGPSAAAPGEIDIAIKGPWLHTILFEVPLLAIVSELYFRNAAAAEPDEGRGGGCAPRSSRSSTVSDPGSGSRITAPGGGFPRWQEESARSRRHRTSSSARARLLRRSSTADAAGTMAHESTCRPAQAAGRACADRRCSRSTPGRASTAATSGIGALRRLSAAPNVFLRDFSTCSSGCFDGVRHDREIRSEWGEETDQALPEDANRSADQDDGLLRFAQRTARDQALPLLQGRSQTASGIGTNLQRPGVRAKFTRSSNRA